MGLFGRKSRVVATRNGPASRTPEGINLKPRRMGFTIDTPHRRGWAHDDALKSTMLDAVSCVLPMGEDFFLDAMRAVRERISDPQLAKDARAFCGQEGHHAFEHRKYNERLAAAYPGLARIDAAQERINDFIFRHSDAIDHIAFTAAAEHMTSILAHAFLADPARWVVDDDEFSSMMVWHTVEELEHKSVCIDVLQHLDDSEARRLGSFLLITALLFGSIGLRQLYMLAVDGELNSPAGWLKLARYYLGTHADGQRGVFRLIARDWLQYFRAGFHPWEDDDRHLVEKWVRAHAAGQDMRRIRIRDYAA